MCAAHGKPLGPVPERTTLGPQLVTTRKSGETVLVDEAERGDHSLASALIIVVFAMLGAITFVGSIAIWLLVRNTGVNWMFQ